MAVSTGFRHRKPGPEAWTMKYVEKNIRHEEGSVLEPCIRRCPDDETTTRAMEPRNGFILENWEILRTSHGGIGTPLLSSYPCDIFDAQVDILQSYRD